MARARERTPQFLTAKQFRDIEATIPPGAKMTPKAWAKLDEILRGYHVWSERHARYDANQGKRWARFNKLVEALAEETRIIKRQVPWAEPDPHWPDRLLSTLWVAHEKAVPRIEYYTTRGAFSGTKNPYRAALDSGVLTVWTKQLRGELSYTVSPEDGEVRGPLIDFMVACLTPVLGDAIPRRGLADIIQRERRRRERARQLRLARKSLQGR